MAANVARKASLKIATTDASKPKEKVPSKKVQDRASKHAWSHGGVILCVTMSAGLNAYANSMHATIPVAGAIIGVMIPCLIFILCKVAGMQYKAKSPMLARFTASVGAFLLLLSVWHCACSLALLTGSHIMLALPMAIAIDGGLVACELDIVLG